MYNIYVHFEDQFVYVREITEVHGIQCVYSTTMKISPKLLRFPLFQANHIIMYHKWCDKQCGVSLNEFFLSGTKQMRPLPKDGSKDG